MSYAGYLNVSKDARLPWHVMFMTLGSLFMSKLKKKSEIRIIAGKWRGKRINVADNKDLRPTADRIRETLFNWLAPVIQNAVVLDLFAGTGALGFEASSRGAKNVLMIEQDFKIYNQILDNQKRLEQDTDNNIEIINTDALKWLNKKNINHEPFNIVFLDPPYRYEYLELCFSKLVNNNWLTENTLIYFETDIEFSKQKLPKGWEMVHNKKAGQVYYYLVRL